MRITKFGHCCLLIEEGGARILIDPGVYSSTQNELKNLDAVLITHEHTDHCDVGSLKAVLPNNPKATIFTNKGVGIQLSKEGLSYSLLEDGKSITARDVKIEAIGEKHALVYQGIPQVDNTGYMVAKKLFYPGDALNIPQENVGVLALPVAGPWMRLSEAIDYAKEVKPKICFPVHDGNLKDPTSINKTMPKILEPLGIRYAIIEADQTIEV
jgi:L-ascorbate metabolism protein UlaG (beta-lactamase superfamily)